MSESEKKYMLSIVVFLASAVSAFYLPGIAPRSYVDGDQLPLYVNSLESMKTTLPYDFYNSRFHFCEPEGGPQYEENESLGSVLMGDRLMTSAFDVRPVPVLICS